MKRFMQAWTGLTLQRGWSWLEGDDPGVFWSCWSWSWSWSVAAGCFLRPTTFFMSRHSEPKGNSCGLCWPFLFFLFLFTSSCLLHSSSFLMAAETPTCTILRQTFNTLMPHFLCICPYRVFFLRFLHMIKRFDLFWQTHKQNIFCLTAMKCAFNEEHD